MYVNMCVCGYVGMRLWVYWGLYICLSMFYFVKRCMCTCMSVGAYFDVDVNSDYET